MMDRTGADPRQAQAVSEELMAADAEAQPIVASTRKGPGGLMMTAVFAVAGVGLFVVLNDARTSTASASALVAAEAGALPSVPEPELVIRRAPPPVSMTAAPTLPPPPPPPPPRAYAAPSTSFVAPPAVDPLQRRRAPSVIIDLSRPQPNAASTTVGPLPMTPAGAASLAQSSAAAVVPPTAGETNQVSPTEAFAARLAGGPETAVATRMQNLGLVVPQGALIPAVLETAINSDLPGFTRAVVSRDVRSFDGRTVLIPRGSRLIGQYKSAVSLGQSRAFVIWTRVVRPDGVTVDLGSPGADQLGRGGLEGEVERHFFERFGGSILLSVLNGIVASIGGNPATQISIGSPAQAASTASSARQDEISPTVKIAQGEAIRVFVARDLDFSAVGPA